MDESKLQSFIQQAKSLTPIQQQLLIRSISPKNDDRPLTEKEKQFIEESKKHINDLHKINATLDKVFRKYE